jgi:transketolase
MRKEFTEAVLTHTADPRLIFLTGDLGFMALEPLQTALQKRFINAGVSEQNMVSMAAALALEGWASWCYSIAPFCYARPFEQIRNDVCYHNLPVRLVGNGGGYGYGVMGPTHHALEDYGILLTLPHMRAFIPCFNEDIADVVGQVALSKTPVYLRLGRGELPKQASAPKYASWRNVLSGQGPVVVAIGPIGGSTWNCLQDLPENQRPNLWILSELPILHGDIPQAVHEQIKQSGKLLVIEEHVEQGGAGSQLLTALAKQNNLPKVYRGLNAGRGLVGKYGSQVFLREQCGLGPNSIKQTVVEMMKV